jgi:uncharacterized protein (TIGR02118 family)
MDAAPVKFVVVLYRRPDLSAEEFQRYFKTVHEPMALLLPDLIGYTQNFAAADATRQRPAWDAVIEFRFTSRAAMEAAWATEAGRTATDDLRHMADLSRSTWGIVNEFVVR